MNKLYKILLVDKPGVFRSCLRYVLEKEKIGIITGETENEQEFFELLDYEFPDIVLMDIDFNNVNGVAATQKAISRYPHIKIISLSSFDNEESYTTMLKAGVKGYILKNSSLDELFKGIEEVAHDGFYFSSELFRRMIISNGHQNNNSAEKPSYSINSRELEIIRLLAHGYSSLEIADEIHLSPKTVDSYRSRLITKTQTKNTIELVVYALKKGLIYIDTSGEIKTLSLNANVSF